MSTKITCATTPRGWNSSEPAAPISEIGITPLLLKGAIALTPQAFPGASDWVVGDLDLVFRAERAPDAQQVIVELGYREATEAWRRMTQASRRGMHHLVPMIHPTSPVHHRITNDRRHDATLETIFAA